MAEYIERTTAKDELLSWAVCINHPEHLMREDAMHVLDSIPSADVAPVRHGRWIKEPGQWRMQENGEIVNIHRCSCCGMFYSYAPYHYCPNCGAKMDLEE